MADPARTPTRARAARLAGLAAVAALGLSACGQDVPTGVAAEVNGDRISVQQVDDLADTLCSVSSATQQQGAGTTASRQLRTAALNRLVQVRLALQLGEEEGVQVDQSAVAKEVASVEQQLTAVPAAARAAFLDDYRDVAAGTQVLTELGRTSLEAQGTSDPDDQAAVAEGGTLLQDYAKKADVEVDPRFGTYADGTFTAGSGSVSVPVSKDATDGIADQFSPDFVGTLPATQTCS